MAEPEPFEALIRERRTRLDAADLAEGAGVWGLALSGGGIRSATFCLGLLRALARRDMLRRFDLLSTVSGGGYIGSTLGRLLSRATNSAEVAAVSKAFADANARWFTWWLRANGRYLIPRGAKDTTFAVALYLRNLAAIHFELGVLALLLGVVLAGVDAGGWGLVAYLGYEFDSAFFDAVRYLPAWLPVMALLLPPATLLGAVVASAYWCIPWLAATETEPKRPLLYWAGAVLFAVVLVVLRAPFTSIQTDVGQTLRQVLWWVAMVLVIAWLASLPVATYVLKKEPEADSQLKADRARNRLTRWLANVLRFGAVLVLLGAVDRFAWYLAFELTPTQQAGAGVALAVAAAVARAVLPAIAGQMQRRGSGLVLLIGRVFGYALTFLLCSWWVSLVHHAALGAAFQRVSPRFGDTVVVLLSIGLPALAYLLLTGRSMSFLNLSSLHAFYRARLVRSYLGAANSRRFQGQATEELPHPMPVAPTRIDVGALERDDDINFLSYRPQQHGGPIHIINVCVNQTRDPRGGLFNQDRKGLLLSVASTGHMRLSQDAWQPLPQKNPLTLGTWTAISGAAIAPGLGSLSRGGISALATFAGLRLGYWWNGPGVTGPTPAAQEGRSALLTKSVGLLRETFGIFRGNERPDWFLTDGGHFENTGAYALLAQRAEVIVLADCGADPDYSFGDLENLVRKARIDLQAEVLFQRPKERPKPEGAQAGATPDALTAAAWPAEMDVFGSLSELASPTSSSCLALARITYGGKRPGKGTLIVVKPNVSDGLPVDLVNFKLQNPAFPQETTADQFFSEAQWESYFELGHFLGGKLTREFVQSLPDNWATYFEPDERSPFEKTAGSSRHAGDKEKASSESKRLPARISATTVGATLGLGAAATVGVSVWQAIDSVRTSSAKQVADERAALKELTDLWAKLPPAVPTASAPASVNALASAIVRTADTLCPANEAGWFQRSAVAEKVYTAALEQCKALKERPQACVTLLEAAHPALQSKLPNCLVREEKATDAIPPPRYWVYDYSSDAPFARAHPCDPAAWERHRADELYRAGVLQLDSAWSSVPKDAAVMWRPIAECFVATHAERLNAAFLGPKEPSAEEMDLASQAPGPVASASATQAASAVAAPTSAAPTPAASAAAASAAASAPPLPPPPSPPPPVPAPPAIAANACAGKTIYLQIYEPAQRDAVRSFREPWRRLGASVPPVEDVTASARAAGRATPAPVRVPTVRYHEPSSRQCAETLEIAAGRRDWTVEPLSARLKPSPGVIEVWIPPPKKAD